MIVTILLIAVSVSMDAFAVSIGKGLAVKRILPQDAAKNALWLGGFQGLFPVLGFFLASTFGKYIETVDHWIIFALLALIGGNMIREALSDEEEEQTAQFDWKHMLPLAIACSLDAFAVGISLNLMSINIWFAALSIGLVTGVFSVVGLYVGRAFGARWQKPAEVAGGVILIAIGLKILLEHLGIIAW